MRRLHNNQHVYRVVDVGGRFCDEMIGQSVLDCIMESGLISAECAEQCGVGCVLTWSANAQEQIGRRIKELFSP